ncbi:hypothetical protein SUGI_0715780 [Cryptomeria japonica]|nr:hypothetical protein SUGI_0715780 [Cryptomeria japonica]
MATAFPPSSGICYLSALRHQRCNTAAGQPFCPPGFDFFDQRNHSKGCVNNPSQLQSCSASGAEMQRVAGVDFPGNDYARLSSTNESACRQACMEDCYCTVVIYGLFNASETCWKKGTPLRFGVPSDSRTVYIKVYSGVPNAVAPQNSRRKKRKGEGAYSYWRKPSRLLLCLCCYFVINLVVYMQAQAESLSRA